MIKPNKLVSGANASNSPSPAKDWMRSGRDSGTEKPTLLVISPDKHYMKTVANPAVSKDYVARVVTTDGTAGDFAEKMAGLDKSHLIIAKGMLETADFLRLILKYDNKSLIIGKDGGFLSHTAMFVKPGPLGYRGRPLILTDAAINIAPSAVQKIKMIKGTQAMFACLFGNANPTISILTPSGKFNPAIQSSIDGQKIIDEMQWAGGLSDMNIRLDQLDTAISAEARRVKGLPGDIADVLVVDTLDAGNAIWKMHTIRGGYIAAGFVLGATVPIVLNSRADSPRSKLLSIKMADKLVHCNLVAAEKSGLI